MYCDTPRESRTPAYAVKGRRAHRYTMGAQRPQSVVLAVRSRCEHTFVKLVEREEARRLRSEEGAARWRRNVYVYGTAAIRVDSTFLVQSIYGAIQEYGGFERPEGLG